MNKNGRKHLLIKLGPADYSEINLKIKNVLSKYEPDKSYQSNLYNDLLKRTELTTVSNLVSLAFIVSILLACLGLIGLAAFTATSRTKEIGIRKINGASIIGIMRLLGISYSRLLIIASLISIPLAFLLGISGQVCLIRPLLQDPWQPMQ